MKRREFVSKLAKGSALLGFPTLIPASALGRDGHVAANSRIAMASIGLGTQGTSNTSNFASDPRVQIVALCDVNNASEENSCYYGYQNNVTRGLQSALKRFKGAEAYTDFREVIARGDIDAVTTATPDHWHAVIAQACVAAGKDVFGEKPLTRTMREGIALRDMVLNSGCVWQTGSWQRSLPNFVQAVELVRNGALGKISNVKIGLPGNFKAEVLRPEPVPEGMDWEMWQGPAPHTSNYNPRKTFTRWRGISDYSAGKIADWGAHHLDITHWALGLDNTGPVEIVPRKIVMPVEGFSDQPLEFTLEFHYRGGLVVEMSDRFRNGVEFFGTKGKMFVTRGNIYGEPMELVRRIWPREERVYPIRNFHFGAFIDSVIDRRKAVTDIDVAHRTNTGCLLGEIAYRLNRPIRWDPEREVIVGDEAAARLCDRAYTAPWQLVG